MEKEVKSLFCGTHVEGRSQIGQAEDAEGGGAGGYYGERVAGRVS